MSKQKGSRTERELLHKFWDVGWYCIRIAGSGSMPMPCPDLLAGKKGKALAIECKSGKKTQRRYISKEQIQELKTFAEGFGAKAYVAMRFDGMPWYFLTIPQLGRSKGQENYYVSVDLVLSKGMTFEELLKKK